MAQSDDLLPRLGEVLAARSRWPDRAAVARALQTRPGTAAPWLTMLSFQRVIRDTPSGIEVDRPRLITVLTAHRLARIRPERPIPSTSNMETVASLLERAEIEHCFAVFSAANEWAFFEPRRDVHLYVSRRDVPAVRGALGPGRDAGVGAGEVQLYAEPPMAIPNMTRNGHRVTTVLQTILDLRAHPEGGAHAAFLEAHMLDRSLPATP